MNSILEQMLQRYAAHNLEEKQHAMKEVMQEIVLCGLARAGFFQQAAFYGGTALRIFYGLDRFSEDLDFSLLQPQQDFQLAAFFPMLAKEVAAYGLKVEISEKEKTKESAIKSAFLKGNTKEHILLFYADTQLAKVIHPDEKIKIKFEVDTQPPAGAGFETRFQLLPAPYQIKLYDAPSLFAGKIHAVLCRGWGKRIKGRDLYDYVFYLSRGIGVNLRHLQERLRVSDAWPQDKELDLTGLQQLLQERFQTIDYQQAKEDVRSFIRDKAALDLWSAEFFSQISKEMAVSGLKQRI